MKKQSVNKETGEITEKIYNEYWRGKQNMRVDTQLSARFRPKEYEQNNEVSVTVPGQSMTILQMLERHRQGLPIDESKGALYQGEELLPDITNMDLIDRQKYVDSVADALVELRTKIDAEAKTEEEKRFIARVDMEVRKVLKEQADRSREKTDTNEIPLK